MAQLKNIFLSASVPYPERDAKFYGTADLLAIREAVRALASVVIPKFRLVWGGHPAITPVIAEILKSLNVDGKEHLKLYQSLWFEKNMPDVNAFFETRVYTEKMATKEESLSLMRNRMFEENEFSAAFFIGGMEGVIDEFEMFHSKHKDAKCFPIASTGAASKIIYERKELDYAESLEDDLSYTTLFKRLTNNLI